MSERDAATTSTRLQATLQELQVPAFVNAASQRAVARALAAGTSDATSQAEPRRLPRYAFVYETQGLAAYRDWVRTTREDDLRAARQHFDHAFTCWQALATLDVEGPPAPAIPPVVQPDGEGVSTPGVVGEGVRLGSGTRAALLSQDGLTLVAAELADEPLRPELTLAFRLAIAGLVGRRNADVRLELSRFDLGNLPVDGEWREQVIDGVFVALVLLVRKQGGWEDIEGALAAIERLRAAQHEFEDRYLDEQGDEREQASAAIELVGLYHLAQMVTLVGEYLRDGKSGAESLRVRLDRHHERAVAAFEAGPWSLFAHLADLLWVGSRELVQNAIWTHITVGEAARQLARLLNARGRPNPILELWPSQQEAFRSNLLDPYPKAILVEMPTSAGKTLLAKFAIVQTLALNPSGTVAYVVPTRALVNQVTVDLRGDFRELGLRVEQSVSAFELDPMEDQLLADPPNVLVTTPEKLDLLVRRDHAATANLAMVIVDEAHHLREEGRGARLELLLGTIKRDRPGARFLLLSPFLPNDEELLTWLGEDRSLPPIVVDWKPGRKVVGAVTSSGRGASRRLVLETLPAADNTDLPDGVRIPLGPPSESSGIGAVSRATTLATLERGSVLVLCRGPGTAMTRAVELTDQLPELPPTPRREAVCHYLDAEIGRNSKLADCLRRGVAYHHSGLSQEARWLIEGLIRRGEVNVVCGTTTLAQGVNFPITTVVVETLQKGDTRLTYADFWNIAGRAGRALVDTLGVVAFPADSRQRLEQYVEFLRGEAQEISSQLADLIDRADELESKFTLRNLRSIPELSPLLQFLAHAMRVGGITQIADEVEDLLRSSLVYHQARRESSERADRLVRLCRSYLQEIRGSQPGMLSLADETGFATPSVLWLMAKRQELVGLTTPAGWNPDRMFGDDLTSLVQCVNTIGGIPEIQLSENRGQPFNPERVAQILRDWVRGETLDTLAERYGSQAEHDPDKRVAQFSRYLFSTLLTQSSWGIGALETVCVGGSEELGDGAYVPSMIYFGVNRRQAVWLRMVGVPRIVADGIADLWERTGPAEPQSYEQLRGWVQELDDEAWSSAIPDNSDLTPDDMRLLWGDFVG